MKKRNIHLINLFIGLLLFAGCQIESSENTESLTDSGRNAYDRIEWDLRRVIELFENSLRLDEEIRRDSVRKEANYFVGETMFQDPSGWWGIMNWNGCRLKALSVNGKSFSEEGAHWIAQSKFYGNDSIVVECLESNRWELSAYAWGNNNRKMMVQMEISAMDMNTYTNLDSVGYYVDLKGTMVVDHSYPPQTLEIEFVADRPLLREKRAASGYYTFVAGQMKISARDKATERKQQFLIQVESLPLNERMIKVTSGGKTEIY